MPRRRRTAVWLLAGLFPCMTALVAESVPETFETPAALRLPELSFSQFGVSYPEVGSTPVVDARFDFVNRGDGPITIEDIKPSCGCLRCHLVRDKKTYGPGETGMLVVRMHTANEKAGPHFYTIDVTARGRDVQQEQLAFRVVLPERKVTLEPSEVYFYQINGEADSRTVYVVDHRQGSKPPFEVTRVDSSSRWLDVRIDPAETDADGRRRIPVVLTVPGDVPAGRETAFVRIATNDVDFTQMALPVLIQGRPEVYGPPIDPDGLMDAFQILASRPDSAARSR